MKGKREKNQQKCSLRVFLSSVPSAAINLLLQLPQLLTTPRTLRLHSFPLSPCPLTHRPLIDSIADESVSSSVSIVRSTMAVTGVALMISSIRTSSTSEALSLARRRRAVVNVSETFPRNFSSLREFLPRGQSAEAHYSPPLQQPSP